MTQPNHPPSANLADSLERKIPGLLWIAIGALGLITVLTLFSGLARGSVTALVAALCNLGLLLGLVFGHKWAYVLLIVFSVLGVTVSFGKSAPQGLLVLIGNAVVVVPVVFRTRYFFPSGKQMDSAPKP